LDVPAERIWPHCNCELEESFAGFPMRDGDMGQNRHRALRPAKGGPVGEVPVGSLVGERVAQETSRLLADRLEPGLYLVATPIGNLADVTLRALAVLARADTVYCEDTRHSRTLLARYGIERRVRAYHEHNAARERPRILSALAADCSVAIISDAGTPLVSDPGFKLVRAVLAAGHRVTHIPGPSAVLAALISAGLPTDSFLFAGFLPVKPSARRARLTELKAVPATLVLFEAPARLSDTLADMAEIFGARSAAVARELTKVHEQVLRGTIAELAAWAAVSAVRGEIAVVVAPPIAAEVGDEAIATELITRMTSMSVRDAAKAVAEALGAPRGRVYDIAVGLKRGGA
jgi:16S rRNA (cytidine1402-2'-O)-methyltransferase